MSITLAERFCIVAIAGMLLAMAVVAEAAGQEDDEGAPELGKRDCGLCEWIIETPPVGEPYDTGDGIRWFSDADAQDFDQDTYNIFRYVWNYDTKPRVVRWINGGIAAGNLKTGQVAYVCHSGLMGFTLERGNIYYKGTNVSEETKAYRGVVEEQKVLDLYQNQPINTLRTNAGITDWTTNGDHRACEGHQRILFTTEITVEDGVWQLRYLIQNQSCTSMSISVSGMGTSSFDAGERRVVEVTDSDAPKAGCLPVTFGNYDNAVTVRVPTFVRADWEHCPDEDQQQTQ